MTGVRIASAAPPELGPVAPEVSPATSIKVALPPVPAFELPAVEPGFHEPRELRVNGRAVLDTDIKVRGTIVWIYDCVTAIAKPGEAPRDVQKRIDADPTLCERPKFYLGSTKETPLARALWVVDVPRAPNKLEREHLPKADLAAWPKVPKLTVGDAVVVTGKFALASPHGDTNSDGLLVFGAIAPAGKAGAPVPAAATPEPAEPPAPALPAAPKPIAVDARVRNDSIRELNACSAGVVLRKLDVAIPRCKRAVELWPGNHLAWYTLGIASGLDWQAASEAYAKAAALRPDSAQYHLALGAARYELAVRGARDRRTVDFEPARSELALALAGNADLWRAHYYLGRIARDRGLPHRASEALSRTIVLNPREAGPYVALAELYRKWDYTDLAIAIATQGTANVTAPIEQVADLWIVLGNGYDDKREPAKAIEAFTKALAAVPTSAKALFARGVAYAHVGDKAKARADLEAFLKTDAPGLELARQQASRMLLEK